MTYRDDLEAAKLHRHALQRELDDVRRRMSELEPLGQRAVDLERAIRDTERDLDKARAKVPLPLLSRVRVASPCDAKWEDMRGDEHVRHCAQCDKDVYDLSSLTADKAESLLRDRGHSLCVRFYRRKDGTVLTQDCPVGKRKVRLRVIGGAVAATMLGVGATMAALGVGSQEATCRARQQANPGGWGEVMMGEPMMGDVAVPQHEMIQGGLSSIDPDQE